MQTLATLFIFLSAFVGAVVYADMGGEAEKEIVRLEPMVFTELPGELVEKLKAQKCTVPQTYRGGKRHNVISGSFAEENQQDWAVLCSRDGVSVIMIFWGGVARCQSEIAGSPDRNWLQGIANNKVGFSRTIRSASKRHHKEYGGPTPPLTSHQGIDDYFLGKGSVVHYCSNGKWLELMGSD